MKYDYKNKKILILGGSYQNKKIVETAKSMGIKTYVTDWLKIDDAPAKQIADVPLMINVTNIDEIIELIKCEKIDGVIGQYLHSLQIPYYKICKQLGLPYFGNEKAYEILVDKKAFKEFCIENNADIIPTYSFDDIKNDKIHIDYPVIIKPTDSRGSRGQVICNDRSEVINNIKVSIKESSNGKVTIEKYLGRNNDVQLVYMVFDNEPVLVRIEDRILGNYEDGLEKLCIATLCPTRHKDFFENANQKIISFIKKMNIGTGPVFLQAFLEGDKVLLYDPGLRFPGDDYDRLYKLITGIDIPKMFIDYALTGKINNTYKERIKNASINLKTAMILPCLKEGKIKSIEGIEQIENHPNVITASFFHKENDVIEKTGNTTQRFCEIVIKAQHIDELRDTIKYIFNYLKVKNYDNEDMLVSKFDISELKKYY